MTSDIVITFVSILDYVLLASIIIRALMSWLMPNDGSGLFRMLMDVTEPVLAPIRRVVPPVGGIDFSPILALILIQLVSTVVIQIVRNAA